MEHSTGVVEAKQHNTRGNMRNKTVKESGATQPGSLCDFPEVVPRTHDDVPTNFESPCTDRETCDMPITKHSCRRYSDPQVCVHNRGMDARRRRRSSTPIFRDVNLKSPDNGESPKVPDNTPCSPDLVTCCQNVATFLAAAVARSNDGAAPTANYIYSYMRFLFVILQLEPECCVYADIYFRRLLSNAKGTVSVHSGNWHRILVGACLLASKYVDDHSMGNSDFSTALTGCSLKFMNKLESKYLRLLKWQLHVPISEYTTRYFELASQPDRMCDWDINFEGVKPHFTVVLKD